MHPARRRLNALLRDQGRLRIAVDVNQRARFDLQAAADVRARTEDLLETVSFIIHDEDFWQRLRQETAAPLTPAQAARLRDVDTEAFAALLAAAGYHSPPPPDVHELIDDAVGSLSLALDMSDGTS
jgi:cytochrome P450